MTEPALHSKRPVSVKVGPAWRSLGVGALAVCAAIAYSPAARAQADANPQMSNTLLLVDTSGSMEYKTASNTFPACRYTATGLSPSAPAVSEKSRWTDLVEVLTGTIANYDCQTLDRGSAAFQNEYKIVGSTLANSPYDFLYANPYHRPMSGTCVVGPGTLSTTNPADFLSTAFNYHAYNNTGTSCSFAQAPDGILDAFSSNTRFGLMTFDTDPSPDQGELGTYSYVVGASHLGEPDGCTTPSPMEVGARNASAPPWEGRMVAFGNTSPGSLDYQNKNSQIQQVLRASRPYGATPIAGMLSDARDFLWNDNSYDLVDTTQKFGPASDPYGSCRDTQVLLLSDGQPNMDLRGHCTGTGCPFQLPEDIARDLLVPSGHKSVKTFVVGFALNTLTVGTTPVDCNALTSADLNTTPGSLCASHLDNPSLQACCNLGRIAVAGDNSTTAHAYFANDRNQLRLAISAILSGTSSSTSRTQPAFSPQAGAATNSIFAASYRFYTNFTPQQVQPWKGQVRRERWICDKDTHIPSAATIDPAQGDLFADNLNTAPSGRIRKFYTVQATDSGGGVHSERSIRPNLGGTDPDGLGATTGTFAGNPDSNFVSSTTPASMGLTDTSCVTTVGAVITPMTAQQCRDQYLKWLVGMDNGTPYTRCPGGICSLLGDIFHANPRIVNSPNDLSRDGSYESFQSLYATRPMVLYTSSNDGMLHAFKTASNLKGDTELVNTKKNNEMWAFIPPEVLPYVPSEYPGTHQVLMDGVSVVKDVVARNVGGTYPYVFERTQVDAASGGGNANVTWRTILVQSFGANFPGYFALDVTNPDPLMVINGEAGGPRFLWQITSDAAGNPLFGTGGATPIITTLLVDEDGLGAKETPVAILPGGPAPGNAGPNPADPGCARSNTDTSKYSTAYPPRAKVPCYTTNLGGRSLTIVRLDTGRIIRTFRRSKLELPAALQARVLETPLDSPLTGEPVAFPSDVGSVADRIFIGDQDGTLWKVDVSNKSPDLWKMTLFWDAYPNVQIHTQPKPLWNDGQPIQTPPVLSVDSVGNLTIALSTGDQNSIGTAPGMLNYVWSLRDLPDASHVFTPTLLWLEQFLNGERVTGPMSLFNSYLYFTSVTPTAANAPCQSTAGAKLWGMHYLTPRDGEGTPTTPSDRTVGGAPAPFLQTNFHIPDQFVTDTALLGTSAANQAVFFGVSVVQVPTCYQSDPVTDGNSGISHVNPGKFQLAFSTGNQKVGAGGQAEADASAPNIGLITLPNLATPAHVEAWASIVE